MPGKKFEDPRTSSKHAMLKRSILGLVAIYNMLPEKIRQATTVKSFQRMLQDVLKSCAASGLEDWTRVFCPRQPLGTHPLLQCPEMVVL